MPFDPDAYLLSKQREGNAMAAGPPRSNFDPDAYLKSKNISVPSQPSASMETRGQAALEGFGQGVSAGYLPQLQAAAGKLMPNPPESDAVNQALEAHGFKIDEAPDTYVANRDANIARQQSLAKQAPGAYYGGMIGGAVASAPIFGKAVEAAVPILKTAPEAGLIAKSAKAMGTGAVQGALQNPGDTQGQIEPLQIEERVKNAKLGAAVGGASQVAGSIIKTGANAVANAGKNLTEYAQMKAFKATGAMLKDFRKASVNGRTPQDIGQEMIDQGFVKPGSTFHDVADAATAAKEKIGQVIGGIYDKANATVKDPEFQQALSHQKKELLINSEFMPFNYANNLEAQFKNELRGKAGGTEALKKVQTVLQELRDNGNVNDIKTVQEFKEGLDDILKYNKALSDEPVSKQYLFKIRDYLKDRIQDRISALDSALGSNSLKELKEANKHYGNLAEISRIAKDRVLRENANRAFGLTDTIAGVGGAAAGAVAGSTMGGDTKHTLEGAALGAGLGLANKGMRTYGVPMATTAASKIGGLLNKVPIQGVASAGNAIGNNPVSMGLIGSRLANQPRNQQNQGR